VKVLKVPDLKAAKGLKALLPADLREANLGSSRQKILFRARL